MSHRFFLYQPNPLLPLFYGSSACSRCIEQRSHFVFRDTGVKHRLVEFPFSRCVVCPHDIEVEFEHLAYFLIEGHFGKCLFYFRFQLFIAWNGGFSCLCCSPCRATANHSQEVFSHHSVVWLVIYMNMFSVTAKLLNSGQSAKQSRSFLFGFSAQCPHGVEYRQYGDAHIGKHSHPKCSHTEGCQ